MANDDEQRRNDGDRAGRPDNGRGRGPRRDNGPRGSGDRWASGPRDFERREGDRGSRGGDRPAGGSGGRSFRDGDRSFRDGGRRPAWRGDRDVARPPRGDGPRGDRTDRPRRDGDLPFRGGDDRRPQRDGERRLFRGGDDRRPQRGGDRPFRGGDRPFRGNDDRRPQRDGDRPFRGGDERRPQRDGERRPFRGGDDRRPQRDGDRAFRGGDRPSRGGDDRRPQRDGDRPFRGGDDRRPQRDGDRSFRGGDDRRPQRDGDRRPFRGGDDRPRRDDRGGDRPRFGDGSRHAGARFGEAARDDWEDRDPYGTRSIRPRHDDPEIDESVSARDLDPAARAELKTLSKDNAEWVAKHLVMAALLVDEDPETANLHALSAARRAGRVAVVRETAAITAYRTGDFATALRELRTYRRISGRNDQLPMMVDCERGLGRPERALELGRSVDRAALETPVQVELAIAMSGARLDLGNPTAALGELEIPQLDPSTAYSWSPALYSAYAATLEELGRQDEADEWWARVDRAAAALEEAADDNAWETVDVVEEEVEGHDEHGADGIDDTEQLGDDTDERDDPDQLDGDTDELDEPDDDLGEIDDDNPRDVEGSAAD
ncbi:primosomal protein [Curtobacterium citreum]|uniref:primosomal protein n=1 Tax=Curtobacterium citreum TaxID=2036 RepID=UPI0025431DE7|nr:primosomal protein [Curtobacterium citreum]WIJ44870.1 primosomal protein [Curtobacterium citreum]